MASEQSLRRTEAMHRWVFGYGSLVWRPAFESLEQTPCRLLGYARRFYQGSTDHRGVPGAPGRVVTLVSMPGAETVGMAYRVSQAVWSEVMATLDHREKGGYERHEVTLEPLGGGAPRSATVYLAGPDNPEFLGPASDEDIARTIATRRGPSGPNDEYLLELERWLAKMGEPDPHVSAIADALRSLVSP
ncbi:MAG: gamma-glutamylcyclotransferase [Sandaracinaceae bacterium]